MRNVDFLERLFVVERHDLSPFYKGFYKWVRVWEYDVNGFRGYLCKFIKIIFSFCKIIQTHIYPIFAHSTWKNPNPGILKNPYSYPLIFQWLAVCTGTPKNEEKPHDTP